jgi:hypothetical protein
MTILALVMVVLLVLLVPSFGAVRGADSDSRVARCCGWPI